ncbi:hypothetical protein DL98DRAFT_508068 [Cadophora sp. DSE1049]|nr:hypothetical protein DL98DRAFT_508068 [Cadophora sp. DSE1049]
MGSKNSLLRLFFDHPWVCCRSAQDPTHARNEHGWFKQLEGDKKCRYCQHERCKKCGKDPKKP